MKLSDKDALLLCVQALPTADFWHEISQDRMIEIHQQAARELARLESIELSSGLTMREPDASPVCLCPADGFYPLCPVHRQPGRGLR